MWIYGLIHLMPVLLELVAGNGLQTELPMEAAFQGELVVRAQFSNLGRHLPQKRELSSHTGNIKKFNFVRRIADYR